MFRKVLLFMAVLVAISAGFYWLVPSDRRAMIVVPTVLLAIFGTYWVFRGSQMPETTVEEKLDKLQKNLAAVRAAFLVSLVLLLLVGAATVVVLVRPSGGIRFAELQAESIVLRAEGSLAEIDMGPRWLWMRDDQGKSRVALESGAKESRLLLSSSDGKTALGLLVDERGNAIFGAGPAGKDRMVTGFQQGYPIVSLLDDKGNPQVGLGFSAKDNRPLVFVMDGDVMLVDGKGAKRVELGAKKGQAAIQVFDEEGKAIFTKP